MVSPARFTTFLILIFILLPLRFSSARSQHQVKKRLRVATESKLETAGSSLNVEIYHNVPVVADTEKRMWFLIPKRKMMSKGVLSKWKGVESEDGNIAKGSTTKGKGHCMIGKCNHEEGQGILNVKHKFSKIRSGRYGKVKMSGFVSLDADYYVPRPHPPKNN